MSDTVKLAASYGTAVVLSLGGCVLLVIVAAQPGMEDKAGLMALLGGFVGSATTFLFGQESATRATRASERAQRNLTTSGHTERTSA